MNEVELKHKIHFIGIGGIGVSAIARMFLERGSVVSGSDLSKNRVTEELELLGAKIFYSQEKENVPKDADMVVYTIAVPDDNPELELARELRIKVFSYPEILGYLSRSHRTIAISGTHGKTTTTAMTAEAMIAGGLEPTVVVGSLLKSHKSNYVSGNSDLFLVEACEYRESFSHLQPYILAITNIEADHLDYYKDVNDVIRAFSELAKKVSKDGVIIVDSEDENAAKATEGVEARVVDYREVLNEINISLPGEHNRKNAAVALTIVRELGAERQESMQALRDFSGTWRRFEEKGKSDNGVLIYDDYAHHPTEIKATLSAAKEKFAGKNIIAVFQPHLFSRTKSFLKDFSLAFEDADQVLILPIYKAREKDDGSVSSKDLVKEIEKHHENVTYLDSFEEAKDHIIKDAKENDVVMTIGAGDVYKVAESLL
ncbi:MAG: Mur ligase domain-containing protein [Candidatus Campbellbacteria bacterium]|nr:Mur ligase domain-containing protein [Candidatus Campbellbacteria bacterium]